MKIINKNDPDSEIEGEVIYVGRGTPLGNPWTHKPSAIAKFTVGSRKEAIEKYKVWLPEQLAAGNPQVCEAFNEILIKHLKGERQTIMCHCVPEPCHAEFIEEMVKGSRWVRNWFSNMKPFDEPFVYQGIEFKTPENYYQAMKLEKEHKVNRKVIASMTPQGAKQAIRKFPLRKVWVKEFSLGVMNYILRVKFAPGTEWRKKLDSTKGAKIIEWNNWNDTFWGRDIFTLKGDNHLGRILMRIRDERHKV